MAFSLIVPLLIGSSSNSLAFLVIILFILCVMPGPYSCFSCFCWKRKEENLENSCSIRTALSMYRFSIECSMRRRGRGSVPPPSQFHF